MTQHNDDTTKQAHQPDAQLLNEPCDSLFDNLCYGCKDGVIIFTETGIIIGLNDAAADLFGYAPEMLVDQPINTIVAGVMPADDNGTHRHNLFGKLDGYLTQMHTGKRSDGVGFPLEMLATPFEDANNRTLIMGIVRSLHDHTDYRVADNLLQNLSPRQLQVLRLVAEGYTSREIAKMLTISVKTVETHRANIMAKLSVRNVTGLVRFAMANKIV